MPLLDFFRRLFQPRSSRTAKPLEVVGPGPWYLVGRGWEVGGERYHWAQYGEKYGPTALYRDGESLPLLLLNIYSYVTVLPDGGIVAWHPQPTGSDRAPVTEMTLIHFPPGSLRPFSPGRTGEELGEERATWHWQADETPASWRLPTRLAPGEHGMTIPSWLGAFEELLILIDQAQHGGRAIAALRPKAGRVTILPLTWFNTGDYDFGYEWVTRVVRDQSGDIVGDGIRIKPFRLDPTGASLKTWLAKSPIR